MLHDAAWCIVMYPVPIVLNLLNLFHIRMCCCVFRQLWSTLFLTLVPPILVASVGMYQTRVILFAIIGSWITSRFAIWLSCFAVKMSIENGAEWFSQLVRPNWSISDLTVVTCSCLALIASSIAMLILHIRRPESAIQLAVKTLGVLTYCKQHQIDMVECDMLLHFALIWVPSRHSIFTVGEAICLSSWAVLFFSSHSIQNSTIALLSCPILILFRLIISSRIVISLFILPSLVGSVVVTVWFVMLIRMNPTLINQSTMVNTLTNSTDGFLHSHLPTDAWESYRLPPLHWATGVDIQVPKSSSSSYHLFSRSAIIYSHATGEKSRSAYWSPFIQTSQIAARCKLVRTVLYSMIDLRLTVIYFDPLLICFRCLNQRRLKWVYPEQLQWLACRMFCIARLLQIDQNAEGPFRFQLRLSSVFSFSFSHNKLASKHDGIIWMFIESKVITKINNLRAHSIVGLHFATGSNGGTDGWDSPCDVSA